jgi:hypothetical protein
LLEQLTGTVNHKRNSKPGTIEGHIDDLVEYCEPEHFLTPAHHQVCGRTP